MDEVLAVGAGWLVFALLVLRKVVVDQKDSAKLGARILALFNPKNSHQASLRTTVLWICMLYEVCTLCALPCALLDGEHSTSYSRACVRAGLIITGDGWWHLLICVGVLQLLCGGLWAFYSPPASSAADSARVTPVVLGKPSCFRQELARCRRHGMSDIQDLLSGDSACDGLPFILAMVMFDLLLVPSVYLGVSSLVCHSGGQLAASTEISCWEGAHVGAVIAGSGLLLWVLGGTLLHYQELKDHITLCLRWNQPLDAALLLAKTGLAAAVAVQAKHPSDRDVLPIVGLVLLVLLVGCGLLWPLCTQSQGATASGLRVAALCCAVYAMALATAAVHSESELPGWPLGLLPVLLVLCYHVLGKSPAWAAWVQTAGERELAPVFAKLREGVSEVVHEQWTQYLEAQRPLGSTERLALELGVGAWSLPSLSLVLQGIGPQQCAQLAAVLGEGQCEVGRLVLTGNRVADAGACALAEALGSTAIRELDLGFNRIGSLGIQAIARSLALPGSLLSSLVLNGNAIDLPAARALGAALGSAPSLTELSLVRCGIQQDSASALLESLAQNPSLKKLVLSGNALEGDGVFGQLGLLLEAHKGLCSLELGQVGMGKAGAGCLVDKLCSSSLQELSLQGNALGDAGCTELCNALKQGTALTSLSLSNCRLGRLSGLSLAKMLMRGSTALVTLDLSNNGMCSHGMFYDGLTALCEAVLQLPSLRHLNLERNQVRNMGCWPLAKMLEAPESQLETLNLASNEIRSRGAAAIFKAVHNNRTLTSLSLRSNVIDSDAVSSLQAVILYNQHLQSIDLENNDLCERGGKLIAAALPSNHSLSMVSLIMNEFRIKDAEGWFGSEVRHMVLLRRKDRMAFDNQQKEPAVLGQQCGLFSEELRIKQDNMAKSKCAGCSCWIFSGMSKAAA